MQSREGFTAGITLESCIEALGSTLHLLICLRIHMQQMETNVTLARKGGISRLWLLRLKKDQPVLKGLSTAVQIVMIQSRMGNCD